VGGTGKGGGEAGGNGREGRIKVEEEDRMEGEEEKKVRRREKGG